MLRDYANPFKDQRPQKIEAEVPRWLPGASGDDAAADRSVSPESVARCAAAAWEAMLGLVEPARSLLVILRTSESHDTGLTTAAKDEVVGNMGRVLSADIAQRLDRSVDHSRLDFADCAATFMGFVSLLREVERTLADRELGSSVSGAMFVLRVSLLRCEEPFTAYANEMRRMKALERMGGL